MAKTKPTRKKSTKSARTVTKKTKTSSKKKVKASASKSKVAPKEAAGDKPSKPATKKAPAKKLVTKKTPAKKPARKPKTLQFRDPVPPPPAQPPVEVTKLPSESQLRKVKTGLGRKDMEHYRQLLMKKRTEILGDVAVLENEARAESDEHLSPEHMADSGSNSYEQEFTLGLVETERRMLGEIDEALLRIKLHTYGVCLERAVPIGKARLDAKPWAKYCIEVVREKERRGEL